MQDLVLELRRELKDTSALGEHGDAAIYRALQERGIGSIPSIRTIARILERRGMLDGRRRRRHPAPPAGWYLPDVVSRNAEIDSFDIIEDLRIKDGPFVDVLNVVSVHGALANSWPTEAQCSAKWVLERVLEHWQAVGLPDYAQFDNDTRFQGAHQHRDVISRVMRASLSLGIVPVFTPPRETGFQAAIEAFNGRWQRNVWSRFHHESLAILQDRSASYVSAHRQRHRPRIDSAPPRRSFPATWQLDLQAHPSGRLIYLRRTTEQGHLSLLGHTFVVNPHWPHRLVRCEVDLDAHIIRFFALRRREPTWQPLLNEIGHQIPMRAFKE
jgi:hypothetical protein